MVTSLPNGRMVYVVLLSLALCRVGLSQEMDDYDPEYDDDLAAGDLEYSDVEAAGDISAEGTGEVSTEDGADGAWEGDYETAADEDEDKTNELPWEWGASRHHSSLGGTTGLLHIVEAGSAEPGTFALAFHAAFFKYSDYLYHGDENSYMWGALNLRVTPLEFLEAYAGFQSSANYNSANYPELFQTLGDFNLGVKGYYSPVDWFTFGGLFGVAFMNPVGEVAVSLEGTSFDLGLMTSFDFTEINDNVPLRAHLNFGYYFDRAANLVDQIEADRGGCGTDQNNDGQVDYQGCLNPVERTALSIDRNDQFYIGIGVDAPFPYVSPILEYNLEIPVNRQDFTCPESIPGSPDSCMHKEGARGMRQWITLGVRVLPPLDSLAIDVGVDFGLTGYAPTVHEMAAQAPYRVIVGLSYAFDPFRAVVEPPPPALETLPPPEPEPEVVIVGFVHDATAPTKAIQGAVITYLGYEVNPQVSDPQGRFRSYPMPPGPVTVGVSAKGYQDGSFTVEIPDPLGQPDDYYGPAPTTESGEVQAAPSAPEPLEGGGDLNSLDQPAYPDDMSTGVVEVKLDCPLTPIPQKGKVAIRVTDGDGAPISGASVKFKGASKGEMTTGTGGTIEQEIDPGSYSLLVEKDGYFRKVRTFEAALDTRSEIEVQLTKKPAKSSVIIKKKRLTIRKKIHFATNSDEIKQDSFGLLDEIADVLISHPELKLIEIQGHTDNRGKRDYNIDLSERRARSVRSYLVDAGVASSRLEAKGFGPKKPIAPNITTQGRSRNRRVEFHILERD